MKMLSVITCLLLMSCSSSNDSSNSQADSYLGESLPGMTPKVFAPGRLCQEGRNEIGPAFSPDGETLYFLIGDTLFQSNRMENTELTLQKVIAYGDSGAGRIPKIFSDGPFYAVGKKGDIYRGLYQNNTFLPAEKMPEPVNSEKFECDFSFTKNHTIYYCSQRTGTKGRCDVYRSRFADGQYQEPENLEIFNTPGSECSVLVHPDENWIIFTGFNRPDGYGSSDMYISFHQEGDSWTVPRNMGPDYNTKLANAPVSLSPDGKYFFFLKGLESTAGDHFDIFWVDARALDQFKPGECCSP